MNSSELALYLISRIQGKVGSGFLPLPVGVHSISVGCFLLHLPGERFHFVAKMGKIKLMDLMGYWVRDVLLCLLIGPSYFGFWRFFAQ